MKNVISLNASNPRNLVAVDSVPNGDRVRAANVVNDLFVELRQAFPAWRQSLKSLDELKAAKRLWTTGFLENGVLSVKQLDKGMRVARKSESPFFPSCGQFIAWCKPSAGDFGLLDAESAYREACNAADGHVWSHDAVKLAAVEVGSFDLRRKPEYLMFPKFKKKYEFFCEKVMRGDELLIALPKPPPVPVFECAGDPVAKGDVGGFLKNLKRGLL